MTLDMTVGHALEFLAREFQEINDVKVNRIGNALRLVVPVRPWWAQVFLLPVYREKEQAEVRVEWLSNAGQGSGEDGAPVKVTLANLAAEPWLYRRVLKIIQSNSIEEAKLNEERQASPFSVQNMWGGPEPGTAPPRPLGFGGDFFGGPKSKKPAPGKGAGWDPAEPGAFTKARDAGRF